MFFCISVFFGKQMVFFTNNLSFLEITEWEPCTCTQRFWSLHSCAHLNSLGKFGFRA